MSVWQSQGFLVAFAALAVLWLNAAITDSERGPDVADTPDLGDDALLSAVEAAPLLRRRPPWVRAAWTDGALPYVEVGARRYITPRMIRDYLAAQTVVAHVVAPAPAPVLAGQITRRTRHP